ncbi:MAG TPA: outer membrane beta-barrel protein [Sphingobium sp.]|nr:outer membrane beta-barrel protein [Sphingobium sp.]
MKGAHALLAALGLVYLPGQAWAQPDVSEDGSGRLVYEAAFFAQFSPSNALQMVQRVPGFTVENVSSEVRGFAQAAGNVVINGQRPSAKSDSLDVILARIPANRVKRIELVAGNELGADYVSKPQVVNLILTEDAGLAGTVEGRVSREYTGRILPRGSAALVYRRGDSSFNASLNYQLFNTLSEKGFDRLTAIPSGSEIEFRNKKSRNTEPFTVAALGWSHEQGADKSIHLNGKVSFDKWTLREDGDTFRSGAHVQSDLYTEDHLWRTWELSGDISRPLAGGAIKFNALVTHRHRRNDDAFEAVDGATSFGGFYQKFDDFRDERVGRLAWSRASPSGWTLEIGAEGAFNQLRTDLNIFNVDGDGVRSRVHLPLDDATVSEYRGEAFVNAGRAIASSLRVDFGLNYEVSRLKVIGDVSARRTLNFIKPKAALDWTVDGWHVQVNATRTVAQLKFEDFVSGATFNTNQVDGGNVELEPQRKWEFLLTVDRKILGDGRFKADLGYNAVSSVQDRIPLTEIDPVTGDLINTGLDAPGNLGSGRELIARTNVDFPLRQIGVKGGRLSLSGAYLDTSVRDPYTLLDRHFTGASLFTYTATFRQDLAAFAWGLEMRGNTGSTFFRIRETDNIRAISPRVSAFVEYRPNSRTTATFGVDNLTNSVSKRWRTFYGPDRTASNPFEQEYRERNPHLLLYLSVKHSFG